MKKLSFILTIILGLGLSSCSVGRYVNPSQNLNLNQTQVVLSEANFKVVKHVSKSIIYTQSATRFESKQLYQSAYAELLREANLTGSQALINVTIELVERTKGLLFPKTDCAIIVSGIVIEFIDPNAPQKETISEDTDIIRKSAISTNSSTNTGALIVDEEIEELNDTFIKDLLHKYHKATLEIEGEMLSQRKIEEYNSYFTKTFNAHKDVPLKLILDSSTLIVKLHITKKEESLLYAKITFIETNTNNRSTIDIGQNDIKSLAKDFARIVKYYYNK